MGIKGLMKLINENAPRAVREQEMANYFGRKIAVDASMSLYQFLIAVRSGADAQSLTNEYGDVTSHLQGMFYRTIRMCDNGIKPVFVFDGKPPQLKSGELAKRKEMRAKAEADLKEAKDTDAGQEEENKYKMRLVKVLPEHNAECKRLLQLMGIPVVQAPSEAEAQCAELCSGGKVYATATEDMDALTFGTSKLVRHMTFAESRKMKIVEIDLATLLEDLKMTKDEFIDLCVLCGCDYTDSIRGVGPTRALKMIQDYGSIEKGLEKLDTEKYKVPPSFLYKEAAQMFKTPEVTPAAEVKLEWTDPDEDGLIQFLCKEKAFSEDRVRKGIERLKKAKGKGTQQRLESFFGAVTVKRKEPTKDDKKKKGSAKKSKKK